MRAERVFTPEEIAAAGTPPGAVARCCGRHRPGDPLHGDGCGLVAVFAGHLAALRRAAAGPPPGPLRCCGRPATPAARTTLPHLVAVRHAGGVADRIIWEVLDRAAFRAWLPHADPPERWLGRLGDLLAVRALLRAADPPAALAPLRRRLAGGHFSMRFVLEHPALVEAALAALGRRGPAGAA